MLHSKVVGCYMGVLGAGLLGRGLRGRVFYDRLLCTGLNGLSLVVGGRTEV